MELFIPMRVFKNVATLGSFSKAADAMDLSPPQVTRSIKFLETSLGVRLIHRTTRKVSLTVEGQHFLERVDKILDDLADATSMFDADTAHFRGRLRLDMPAGFARTCLIKELYKFSHDYPNIDLRIGVTDRTVDLVGEGADCALRIGDLQNSSLIGRHLVDLSMVTCASPEYLAAHGVPHHPDELAAHQQVSFISGVGNKANPWHFLVDNATHLHIPTGVASTNETNAYIEFALSGFGIIQLPGLMVERYLTDGALVEVLAQFKPCPRPLSIVYPSRTHVPPYIKAFFDWLNSFFQAHQSDWISRG